MRLLVTTAALFALCASAPADAVRVGAAVSLKDAFAAIAADYEKSSGDTVELTFGSSGQVQQQVKAGAELDLFVSAAEKQVDELTADKLADAATRRVVVRNTLVLIVPRKDEHAPRGFADLGDATRTKWLAVGEPKTVPAGQYAMQTLATMKLDGRVGGRLVYGTNVRQVLTYVERGEVSAGIVYGSDAKQSGDKVRVAEVAAESTHEPIVYPGVVLTRAKHADAARRFLDHLTSPEAQRTLVAAGFVAADAAPATAPTTQLGGK